MSKIDYINLSLESVEAYTVPSEAIKKFSIKGIKVNTQLNNHHGVSIKLPEPASCEGLILDLRTKYISDIPTMQTEDNGEQMMLPNRLVAYRDIVSIDCVMDSGTSFNVYLPYESNMADDNLLMNSSIVTDKDGEKIVHIVVKNYAK